MTADRLDSDRIFAMRSRVLALKYVCILLFGAYMIALLLPTPRWVPIRIGAPACALAICWWLYDHRFRRKLLLYARQNDWLICPHDFYPLHDDDHRSGIVSCSECGRSWQIEDVSRYWYDVIDYSGRRRSIRKPKPLMDWEVGQAAAGSSDPPLHR